MGIRTRITTALLAIAVVMPAERADAALNDCAGGAFGFGGNACVWSGASYTGTKYFAANSAYVTGHPSTYASIRSYGNRITNRMAAVYTPQYSLIVDMCSNCGNSSPFTHQAFWFDIHI